MIATLVISIVTFITILLSLLFYPTLKIKKISVHLYWIIALIGAILLLSFLLVPINEVWNQLTSKTSINPIKILILFFSMTFLSVLLDEFGLFNYLASRATLRAKNQKTLFFTLYFLVSILTIFTSNDVVILTFTPFIVMLAKRVKIDPIPYLVSEFVAANTWSLLFIIGNPTNIFLATSANISFINYFKVMAIPTLLAGLCELLILYLIFKKNLNKPIEDIGNEMVQIKNKPLLINGVIHLIACLILLVISNIIHLEMWFISLICALSLLISTLFINLIQRKNKDSLLETSKRLPYQLIPFFISMFVIVVALNYQGISLKITNLLGNKSAVFSYGYSSFVMSNVINNIPMSILYSTLCSSLDSSIYLKAVFASIIGSNIGAFLTPIGALAGIMFTSLLAKYEIRFSFIDFIKYGAIISMPTISVALTTLNFII